jgi:hypothetical protein
MIDEAIAQTKNLPAAGPAKTTTAKKSSVKK